MEPPRPALRALVALVPVFLAGPAPALADCPSISLLPRALYSTAPGPVQVVVGDFTWDGVPDLAVTQSVLPATIGVLPGLGIEGVATGVFGALINTSIAGDPNGLATADFNGDGHPDLAVGNRGNGSVQVLIGTGNAHFAPTLELLLGAQPYGVHATDLNADGIPDLAVANNNVSSMQVLIAGNNGSGQWNGTFAPPVAYPTNGLGLGITSGDFNNDGILDLVVTEHAAETVALFLGQGSGGMGNGTFLPALHVATGPVPYSLAPGDFNEDGSLDLAVAVSGAGGLRVLLGSGTGTFPVAHDYMPGVNNTGVDAADFDGDGILDLVVSSALVQTVSLLKGQGAGGVGDGTFAGPVAQPDDGFSVHVIAEDVNVDGRPDAVSCRFTGGGVSVFLNGCGSDPNAPSITRIRDVPNDEGGKVFVTWTRSALDITGGAVNAYRVWRMVPPETAPALLAAAEAGGPDLRREFVLRPDGTSDIVYWEALATLPAQRLPGYGYTAATLADSTRHSRASFTYRITAATANIDVFYDSDPDSGCSVDNLPPHAPKGLSAGAAPSGGTLLAWDESPEPDLECYNLYRSMEPDFVPSPATLLATLTAPGYLDANPPGGTYKLEAVDQHGNAGEAAAVQSTPTTDVPGEIGRAHV